MNRSSKSIFFTLPLVVVALPSSASDSVPLEEVFVTATRFESAIAELNMAAYQVNSDLLETTAAVHFNEIGPRVPNVWISRGNGQESLVSVRSPVLTGSGGCGSVLMAQNGVSLRAPGFCNVNQLFDAHLEFADRLEMITGPTPATYGANGLHGMINLITPSKSTTSEDKIELETGPNAFWRLNTRNGVTTSGAEWKLGVTGVSDGGFKQDAGYDQHKLSITRHASADQTDHATFLSFTQLNQETAGYIQGDDVYRIKSLKRLNPNPEAFRDASSFHLSHTMSHAMDTSGWSVTGFVRHNNMRFLQHFLPWQAIEKTGHSSIGLQTAWRSALLTGELQLGFDTQFTKGDLQENQPRPFSPNQPQGAHYDYTVAADTSALFALFNQPLGDSVNWSMGVRTETTGYDYDNRLSNGSVCAPTASACRFYRPSDTTDRFSDINAHIGIVWQLRPEQALRLNIARGFRPPETGELYRLQNGQAQAKLDSETMQSVEIGYRTEQAHWTLDATAYDMDKTDVIFQDANRFYVTGAKTSHKGAELLLTSRSTSPWRASLSLAYAEHRYANNPGYLGVNQSIQGNAIDTAPRWLAGAHLGYNAPRWATELELVYQDEYATEPTNQNTYPGHTLINLRASWTISPQWQIGLRVMNLTDTDYAERADYGFGQERYFVGEPRSLFWTLRYSPQS